MKLREEVKKAEREREKVCAALEGEVCVRTDLVSSVTTDLRKQAVGSGPACCGDPAVFKRMMEKTPAVPWYSPFLLLAFFLSYQQATVHN